MKQDFDIIIRKLGNKDVKIYPISDIHLGDILCKENEWAKFCDKINNEPLSYIMLVGDIINNATRSSVSNVFEETLRPMEQKDKMVSYLSPIKDRILCAVSGNHEDRSLKDADDSPMYDIMCKLNIEELYRPNMAFMKIILGSGTNKNSYTFAVTHNGSNVNKNESYASIIEGIDIMVYGHTHRGMVTKPSRLIFDPRNNKIAEKETIVINSQSWLSYGGYASKKLLKPNSPADTKHMQSIVLSANHHDKSISILW